VRHPCKPLLIATYNPEEGNLRDHLLDRFAINLSSDKPWTDFADRITAVQRATQFQVGATLFKSATPLKGGGYRLRATLKKWLLEE
jgi:magnesium chelatase subunit D